MEGSGSSLYLWAHISEPAPLGHVYCRQANWQERVEAQGTILATESAPAVSRWGSAIQARYRGLYNPRCQHSEGPFGALQRGGGGMSDSKEITMGHSNSKGFQLDSNLEDK